MAKVFVFGASGFVGRHLCGHLIASGHEVTALLRRPEVPPALRVLPGFQWVVGAFDGQAPWRRSLAGHDVAINCTGLWTEKRAGDFARVHVDLTRIIADACVKAGVPRLIHVSALAASAASGSRWARSKWQGELALAQAPLDRVIVRPAPLLGPDDHYLQRCLQAIDHAPWWLPVPMAETRAAPLLIQDLVAVLERAIGLPLGILQRFDLCGPTVQSVGDWLTYLARLRGRPLWFWRGRRRWPGWLAAVVARLPWVPWRADTLQILKDDLVCQAAWPSVFPAPMLPERAIPGWVRRRVSHPGG